MCLFETFVVAVVVESHDVGYSVSFVFIPFGFIADPIVYIFNLKANRLAFARVLPCNNFVHPTESLSL